MGHSHAVRDTDTHFKIDPATRAITKASGKLSVMQYDHNSERLTFEMQRHIEGHDMSVCNKVEVHFLNIDGKTKDVISGHRELEDFRVSEEDAETVVVSWLITKGATKLGGKLNFLLTFRCVEDGIETYSWHTDFFLNYTVKPGLDAAELFETEYVDVIEQWKASVMAHFTADLSMWKESAKGELSREIDQKIAVERARIDNLASLKDGSTTGDAELQDIRIGTSGAKFPTAGAAVRNQIGKLENAISKIFVENIYDASAQTAETITDNAFIQSGKVISNANYFITAPIDVSRFAGSDLYFNVLLHGYATESAVVSCFDSEGNFITEQGLEGLKYTVPIGAGYIRLTVYKYSYWDIDDVNNAFMLLTENVSIDFFPYGTKFLIPEKIQPINAKIAIAVRANTVNFTAPSGSRFLHYTMKYFGGSKNAFFDFANIAETEEFATFPDEETTLFVNGSDFFGPYIVKAINNADGDMIDSLNFTGASHAYSGNTEGATSATGRSEVTAILVDGVRQEEYSGYCNIIDIYWTNYVQATNTKKEDGSGREVLREEYHLRFDGDRFEIENDITALESIDILRYYGLQIAQGVPGYSYDVSYIGSHNNIVQANGNSKSADTICREIHIQRKDLPVECRFGLHPIGLGTFYCNSWYSAFDTEYGKTYLFMICPDKSCKMIKDQQVNFKGYYKFRYCE